MTKRKSVLVCLLIAMFSFLLFGCKQDIKVENIYFNAPSTDGVVLLVGETYTPEVYFSPRYPTNKAYKISSYNDAIVSARNNQITALTAGKSTNSFYPKISTYHKKLSCNRKQMFTPTIAPLSISIFTHNQLFNQHQGMF